MKIIKYLFLLLLLSLVASSIFLATQKGDFSVERSKVINSPRPVVYAYVNDYKNWEDFGSWSKEDPEMKFYYPQMTVGKGASYSWEGKDGTGNMQTILVKENDSIVQKMNFDGTVSDVTWTFKDTLGGTKVTWKTKGKMSFLFKIYSAFNGGVDNIIGTMYQKSLASLDRTLDYEIKTFSTKVEGVIKKPETFYVYQSFTSEISKVIKNFKVVSPTLIAYCDNNNVEISGKPFIIYHTYNSVSGLSKISICVPIKTPIYTSESSQILSGKLAPYDAVKTTLTGDYSHISKALDKARGYLNGNKLIADGSLSHIAVFTTTKAEVNSPSKWVTEIYLPLKPASTATPLSAPPTKTDVTTSPTEVVDPNTTDPALPTTKTEVIVPKAKTDAVVPKAKKTTTTPPKEVEIPAEF